MTSQQALDPLRAEHVATFGPMLGPVFHALHNQLVWLHAKWRPYRQLFGHSQERVTVLNKVAPFFFRVIEDAMWDDIMMHLCRLTDPPKTMGKPNLTLQRLPQIVPSELSKDIRELVQASLGTTKSAREWRNRRGAHTPLASALGEGPDLLGPSLAEVEHALEAMRNIMNRIASHFKGSYGIAYEGVLTGPGDGEALVHFLQIAVAASEKDHDIV